MEPALARLGFMRYREVGPDVAEKFRSRTGQTLPEKYVTFLCQRETSAMPHLYSFDRQGESWEGCVSEFHNIAPHADDLDDLASQAIRRGDGSQMLPIGSDPGGNWLCLNLTDGRVYDMDYGSGVYSLVAPNFESFVSRLQANAGE